MRVSSVRFEKYIPSNPAHGLFPYALTADFLIFNSFFLSFVPCELLAKNDTNNRKKESENATKSAG
jgi:hypothetical protein